MSGLGETGELYGFVQGGAQVAQSDLDQYDVVAIDSPSVSASWFGTCNGGTAASGPAITLINALADYPRNIQYTCTGVASGTFGGTFQVNYIDQFGVGGQEKVTIASAANGGTTYGTAIVAKFISGTFTSQGSSGGSTGTAQIGFGTAANGSAQSNWFGLMTRIAGTSDVKMITWINSTTVTTLNKGTAIGTLVAYDSNGSLPSSAFQGTSGVAITDHYKVVLKPTYNNIGKGLMSAL